MARNCHNRIEGVRRTIFEHGGAHTVIIPFNHGFECADVPMNQQPLTKKGIVIADNVWIGASCCILDGVRIGKGAIIGAGAVVTKDLNDYSVAIGVPAVAVRSRSNAAPDPLSSMRGE